MSFLTDNISFIVFVIFSLIFSIIWHPLSWIYFTGALFGILIMAIIHKFVLKEDLI